MNYTRNVRQFSLARIIGFANALVADAKVTATLTASNVRTLLIVESVATAITALYGTVKSVKVNGTAVTIEEWIAEAIALCESIAIEYLIDGRHSLLAVALHNAYAAKTGIDKKSVGVNTVYGTPAEVYALAISLNTRHALGYQQSDEEVFTAAMLGEFRPESESEWLKFGFVHRGVVGERGKVQKLHKWFQLALPLIREAQQQYNTGCRQVLEAVKNQGMTADEADDAMAEVEASCIVAESKFKAIADIKSEKLTEAVKALPPVFAEQAEYVESLLSGDAPEVEKSLSKGKLKELLVLARANKSDCVELLEAILAGKFESAKAAL